MTVQFARTPVGKLAEPERFRVFELSPGNDLTVPADGADRLILGVNAPGDYLFLAVTEQSTGTITGTQDQTTGSTNYNTSETKIKTLTNIAGIFEFNAYYDGVKWRQLILPPVKDVELYIPAGVVMVRFEYVSSVAADLKVYAYLLGGE